MYRCDNSHEEEIYYESEVSSFINWPDSENDMTFVWKLDGVLNEIGIISYHDGVASVIEKDEDGNDTTSVLSDHEQGTFALLNDGTLQ